MATTTTPDGRVIPVPPEAVSEKGPIADPAKPTAEEVAKTIMNPPNLLDSNCKRRAEARVDENRVTKGSSLAADIREVTEKIRYYTDCNTIQAELKKQLNTFLDANKATVDEIKRKLEEILPIIKIPTNPFKLPGYIKKATIGRVLPDLDATLDFLKRAIEVITAVAELAKALQDVEPRLKACAVDTIEDVKGLIENEIDKQVDKIKEDIRTAIRETICGGLNELGISPGDIADVIDLVNTVKEMQDVLNEAIGSVQSLMKQYQGDLQDLTGVPPVFNFQSVDLFIESVQVATTPDPVTGVTPYEEYKAEVAAVVTTPDPVNVVAPVVSGTVEVGSTLTVTNGQWTDGTNPKEYTYTYQWYRAGVPIPEATNQTYVLDIDDFDRTIYCIVTAAQQVAQEDAQSNTVGPVLMPTAVGNVPTITGSPTVGSTLTVSPATITQSWYTRAAPYRQYRWLRINATTGKTYVIEEDTESNSGPFTATYEVTSADVGFKIMASEYVSMGLGSVKLDTAQTAVVT